MTGLESKLQNIVINAYTIFTQNGIKCITIDDLCKRMGISKKTFYKYFDNKTDLLNNVSKYVHEQISNRILILSKSGLNAIDVLLEMSKVSSESHIKINPAISLELRQQYPEVYETYFDVKKKLIIDSIISNLEKGIKEGLYRLDLNKEIVAHLYFKKIEEFHLIEAEDIKNFTFAKIFEVMFENHIRGISNEKGIAYFEKQKEKLNFNI